MKALITAVALVALATSAMADPTGKRTPNGGFEYYSNTVSGKATVESDCVLPWVAATHDTMGVNGMRRVEMGDITVFYDCTPLPAPVIVVEKTKVVVQETVVEKKVEVVPAPAPAPVVEPAPQPKHIRE